MKSSYSLAANALVGLPQVHGVVQQRLVVGAHVQRYGQTAGGVDATGPQGIEGELADGDAPCPPPGSSMPRILAVGDDDDARTALASMWRAREPMSSTFFRGDVEAARLLEAVAELLAGLPYGRGIDGRVISLHVAQPRA